MPHGTNPGTNQFYLCHGFKLPLWKGLCLTGRCNKIHSCQEQSGDPRRCVSLEEGGKDSRSWVASGSHSSPRFSCACHSDSVSKEVKWGHGQQLSGLRLQMQNTFVTGRESREEIKSMRYTQRREGSETWGSLLYPVWVHKEKGVCSDLVREKPHKVTVTVEMAGGTTARIITTQESTEQPKRSKTSHLPVSCSTPALHLRCNHRVTFFTFRNRVKGKNKVKIHGAVLTK